MVKSLFPLNTYSEEHIFEDPDQKLKSLPYSSEIPEVINNAYKTPPYPVNFFEYQTCRERVALSGLTGFLGGWFFFGPLLAQAKFGFTVNRWRILWCEVLTGLGLGVGSMLFHSFSDITCSPYMSGRRRPMFDEEAIRHSLNAKYRLYENLEKIMHSRHRITKQEYYQTFIDIRESQVD